MTSWTKSQFKRIKIQATPEKGVVKSKKAILIAAKLEEQEKEMKECISGGVDIRGIKRKGSPTA